MASNGGHLGSNLGIVELTLAMHRVFDSPAEPILFDVGHQAYVHKMLTGRAAAHAYAAHTRRDVRLPAPGESPHDWIENSHASTALSYADGMAKSFALRGERASGRRGGRRRRADRRHVLGSAEQHRRLRTTR